MATHTPTFLIWQLRVPADVDALILELTAHMDQSRPAEIQHQAATERIIYLGEFFCSSRRILLFISANSPAHMAEPYAADAADAKRGLGLCKHEQDLPGAPLAEEEAWLRVTRERRLHVRLPDKDMLVVTIIVVIIVITIIVVVPALSSLS